jgi:hypothetical protein
MTRYAVTYEKVWEDDNGSARVSEQSSVLEADTPTQAELAFTDQAGDDVYVTLVEEIWEDE